MRVLPRFDHLSSLELRTRARLQHFHIAWVRDVNVRLACVWLIWVLLMFGFCMLLSMHVF